MSTTDKLAEAARQYLIATAHLGACPGTREVLERAIAEAEAKPAPAPLTNADVVEAWRTTEARRDDYGWTSCEWFQEGVRFAQRHYRVGAAAPAALAALEAEAKPAPAEPVGWALVPVEPTADMRNAYHAVTLGDAVIMGESGARWAAMLAAAPAAPAPLTYEQIVAAANEAFDTTVDLDDETLINKYGHGVYISRFVDFARAIERAHGIGKEQA